MTGNRYLYNCFHWCQNCILFDLVEPCGFIPIDLQTLKADTYFRPVCFSRSEFFCRFTKYFIICNFKM